MIKEKAMAEVINLRQARKRRVREERGREAEANRVRFGRPKAERQATTLERERAGKALEGHQRQRPEEGVGGGPEEGDDGSD
ncbi:hypothetical protein CKO38_04465 [Rhodospirillum rubrum]|uniref:DUF4169 family protein n=1 Tax=Rhodospirillum rubrum TaxID=1085 RepID=UPI0019060079|nr:DUF4169 family protein [Rhodospirillum rubrum]MBK1663600.1 hypothetical protein [Rhodospirillum rubrum]MBK1675939.1 hypothetical protein [Rhodospirillum rubrum]